MEAGTRSVVDFFEHQDRAKRNTLWLVVYFAATVVTIVALVYFVIMAILVAATQNGGQPIDLFSWHPTIFIAVVGCVVAVILSGSLYKTWELGSDGNKVAIQLGGVKIQPNTRNLDERILLNVVEEMALASGTPVPPVYLLPMETGINAFAAGTTPQNAVIGVTRGCVETMTRDELQGVIAHEFSHILNGDMKLNLRLIGMLHGILLIAMIGYVLFRMAMEIPVRSSSKDDDDAKGIFAIVAGLFATGAALVGIGYAGVFFASLIQAAVSRQREFLADASAVQFTRNPLGIAGALKRIGGWKQKSVMKAVYAKEASHMFFGQGIAAQWFRTHPPLPERIRRIDPSFKGTFSTTEIIEHSESDIVDPRTLGFARSSGSSAHQAALAGVEHFEERPVDAVLQVGKPEEEHLQHASRLVEEMDADLVSEVHDPYGAVTLVCSLLLAPKNDPVRQEQLKIIERYNNNALAKSVEHLVQKTDLLQPEQRLPIACMALPALDQLSDPQFGTLRTTARALIDADSRWTIFEYAIQRFITKRLLVRSSGASRAGRSGTNINAASTSSDPKHIASAFTAVLSTLAHLGGNDHANAAFDCGWSVWGKKTERAVVLQRDACTLKLLDSALDVLATVSGDTKRSMLNAFSECIAYDRRTTINEVELLRVISDAMGCPMPPVLDLAL